MTDPTKPVLRSTTKGNMTEIEEKFTEALEKMALKENSKSMDLAAASMIEVFRGDGTGPSVRQFFAQVDQAAILGRWKPQFKVTIVRLKIKGAAETFITSKFDFNKANEEGFPAVDYEELKRVSIERFVGKRTDQYHYTQLQSAVQKPKESVEQFAERIRHLGVLTIAQKDNEAEQKVLNEEGERRMLASFLHGLKGKVGEVTRFRFPKSWEEAVEIAVLVEAEEQCKGRDEVESSVFTVTCWDCQKPGHVRMQCPDHRSYYPGPRGTWRGRGNKTVSNSSGSERRVNQVGRGRGMNGTNRIASQGRRNQTRGNRYNTPSDSFRLAEITCYACGRKGHYAKDCRVEKPKEQLNTNGSSAM